MATSDPQSQKKRTWGEYLFGDEKSAAARAQYKREMGINPAAKKTQNVEAAISSKSMENPTSKPVRTEPSSGKLPLKREPRKAAGTYTKSYDVKRGTAGTYTSSYDVPGKKAVSETPQKKTVTKTSGARTVTKSVSGAPTKMSAFERQKMRLLEKEGWGGRSMTSAQAKARVQKERGYKASVPSFGSKVAKPVTKSTSKAPVKQGSTSSFAAKMQGRNDPRSPTYSGTKSSGFKFKDLFKKK